MRSPEELAKAAAERAREEKKLRDERDAEVATAGAELAFQLINWPPDAPPPQVPPETPHEVVAAAKAAVDHRIVKAHSTFEPAGSRFDASNPEQATRLATLEDVSALLAAFMQAPPQPAPAGATGCWSLALGLLQMVVLAGLRVYT